VESSAILKKISYKQNKQKKNAGLVVTKKLTALGSDLMLPAGVANIIDAALEAGAAVALLGATCSVPEEQAMSAAAFALGARRRAPVPPTPALTLSWR